ncbi:bifunctional lysylphosphatidylglycerol flippase/synthetase MprF [Microbacterium sp.]|uniref:bifunctional lysylphosphatidylglycerol flippase/synthetase MprF n=1 Tax=Microbacterium sp. TaxID=51671 RepID=UPI003A8FA22C
MVGSGIRYLRRSPFSVALAITVMASGFVFSLPRTHAARWVAAGPVTTGEEHLWWTSVTALLVPGSLLDAVLSAAVALTVMAYIERLIGTARTVLAFFGIGVAAVLAGIGLHLLTIWLGTPLLLLARPDLTLDPAIGMFGVLMTGSAFAPTLFRRRIRVIGFAVVLTFALYGGDQDSLYRVIAAVLGLGLGALLRREMPVAAPSPPRRPPAHGWRRASYGEVRTLVAAVVAVTGIGPVIVLLDRTVTGPLALVVSGFATVDRGEAFETCATYFRSVCDGAPDVHMIAHGVGQVVLSLVPVALSLVAAWGLRTGRRAAWIMALVVTTVSLVATGAAVGVLALSSLQGIERVGERFALEAVLAVGVILSVIVMLVLTRRRFEVAAARPAVRRFWLTVGVAFATVVVLWIAVVVIIGRPVVPLGFRDVFLDLIVLLLPAGLTRGVAHGRMPQHGVALLVDQWAGVAFWLAVVVAAVVLLRSIGRGDDPSHARFRELLRTVGGGTMSFMGTWEGVHQWIGEDGAVAYRLVGGVALVVGDPVAAPGDLDGVLTAFLAHCDRHGWTPIFYSVHAVTRDALRARGWRDVSVGEETVIRPIGLDLAGGRWKRVRQALARAEREGVQAVWARWDDLPAALSTQIEVLSEQWVAEKALPELGFTLGGLTELRDPDVALLLAVDAGGRLQAVTSWLPSWRDERVVGWTLDFMRRGDDAMPEIMVFLIAAAVLRMRDAGIATVSLSGAPLVTAPVPTGQLPPQSSLLGRVLAWLADLLEPVYGFRSLFAFKQKFHPELETMYLAYEDAASLPTAASAILRAYLPAASPRQILAVVRGLSVRRG